MLADKIIKSCMQLRKNYNFDKNYVGLKSFVRYNVNFISLLLHRCYIDPYSRTFILAIGFGCLNILFM